MINYEIVVLENYDECVLVLGTERFPFKRLEGITVGDLTLTPRTLELSYVRNYPTHRRVGREGPKEKVIPFWQQKQEQHKFRTKRKH